MTFDFSRVQEVVKVQVRAKCHQVIKLSAAVD